ncbi:MAG: class I SAM-dependent methyltransferase [Ilumatobacteraceae bacterium]
MRKRVGRASFEDADVALEQALEELDVNVPNYNEWLRSLLEPAAHGRVIELGAGVGTFTVALLETATHVVAVEPSARQGAVLVESTAHDHRITPIIGYAPDAISHGPFDGAVLSNVLEHIEDDEPTLREMFEMLKPGGAIAVFSPAFGLLMSDFDRSIGHVRRYRKRDLVQRFERVGFEVTDARYVNMPGFFAWLLIARLCRQRPTGWRLSRFYDRMFVPKARWLESKVRAPFGQSVLVIGRVPKSTTTTDLIDDAEVVVGG